MSFDETNFPELPPSWTSVSVDQAYELVTVKDKIQAKSYLESGGLAVVDQGSALVGGYTNATSAAIQTNLPVVVFGDHTRAIKYIDFPFAAGADGIKVLRPAPCLLPRLFFHFLKAIRLPDKGYARHFQFLRTARIAVPPLNEQKRIADKLDAVLARVDACREHLDRVPAILKRFRQSVLAAATSGKLTEEWREERPTTSEWPSVELGSVARDFSYGSASKSSQSGDVPVLRMGNIQDGRLDWADLVYTSNVTEITKYHLTTGDVLFNRTNSPELVGKTAVYRGEREAIYAGYLIRVRCTNDLLPDYLNYCLNSPAGRDYCWRVKSDGVSQSNINAKKLAAFTFGLPSIEEQHEIIRRVESLFAYADRFEARYTATRAQVERLTQALLAKAFHGKLVPQDPNDEPASVLLARIRAAREAAPAKSRQRKGSSQPSKTQKAEVTMLNRKDIQDTLSR